MVALGVRAGTNEGTKKNGDMERIDAFAVVGMPWSWRLFSDWDLTTRVNTSAGALVSKSQTSFIYLLGPGIALGQEGGWFTVDIGVGGALLSDYTVGNGDTFGGPFQFTADIGFTAVLYRHLGVGYRFQHMSDATIYGTDNRGLDLHMLELSYRF